MKKLILFTSIFSLALLTTLLTVIKAAAGNPQDATSNIYYVDQNSPKAVDDESHGTEAMPWKTIQYAADHVESGDTVYVKSGTYDEKQIIISLPVTPTETVTFKADPLHSVKILHGFNISSTNKIRLEGFDITTDDTAGILLKGDDIEIIDNYIHDVLDYGGGILPLPPYEWKNVKIINNHIYRCTKGFIVSGENWLVENNEIEQLVVKDPENDRDADYARFFGSGHIFRGNYFHDTNYEDVGDSHVDCYQTYAFSNLQTHDILFENNMCLGYANMGFMMQGNGTSHDTITIHNNVIANFTNFGVIARNIQNLEISNNTWIGLGTEEPKRTFYGVFFQDETTGVLKNNIFTNIMYPYRRDETSSYTNSYNLTFGCYQAPDPGSETDLLDTNPQFFNETNILGPDRISWTKDDGLRPRAGSPAATGGEGGTSIGAYEFEPVVLLQSLPANESIQLDWDPNIAEAPTSWTIHYTDPLGNPQVIEDIAPDTHTYTITDLSNNELYTVTVATVGTTTALSDTSQLSPTDQLASLTLTGTPANQAVHLAWDVTPPVPDTITWKLDYEVEGETQLPIDNIAANDRSYIINNLTNYKLYTITISTVGLPYVLSDTIQIRPAPLALKATPDDQSIHLNWTLDITSTFTGTWHIDYYTTTAIAPLAVTIPLSQTREYTLENLANDELYTVTLSTIGVTPALSATVQAMPISTEIDYRVYLPLVQR